MNPLPPQAYTKDTLVKAYQWLQHQNDNIREMATNPDILVSLFLKAKMQGESALERPSIQNFKSELKSLAGMMSEFEVLEPGRMPPQSSSQVSSPPSSAVQSYTTGQQILNPTQQSQLAAAATQAGAIRPQAQSPAANFQTQAAPCNPPLLASSPLPELDTRSWLMIHEVKNQMNLSSDVEALRLLISVGRNKLKSLMND